MAMTLITGTPGAGKTIRLLVEGLLAIGIKSWTDVDDLRSQYKKQGRLVVAVGVDGLIDGLFDRVDTVNDWGDYPDGTLFLVDEAWKWWGPEHEKNDFVKLLAEHRHQGMDFIFTCQMPSQLGKTCKALTDRHLHVTRKFNTKVTQIYEWPNVVSNPNSQTQRVLAIAIDWVHPVNVFELYKSASVHTMKRRLPWRVIMIPIVAVGVMVLIGFGIKFALSIGDNAESLAAPVEPQGEQGTANRTDPIRTPEEYLNQFQPRVASQPWSAPIYDGMKPSKAPRLFCISTADSCTCMTQQGTKWTLDERSCRVIARWGQYEPLLDIEEKRKTVEPRRGSVALHDSPRSRDERESGFGPSGITTEPTSIGPPADAVQGWLK